MSEAQALADVVRVQAEMIAELRSRIERLEGSNESGSAESAPAPPDVPAKTDASGDAPSRRGFLRLAGLSAAGAAVAVVGSAGSAAAVDGGTFSGAETVYTNTGADVTKAGVKGTFTQAGGIGVLGQADNGASAAGVIGSALNGYGVYGTSSTGYALYAGSNGRLGFDPHLSGSTAPTTGGYKLGDVVMNSNGDLYACVVGGSGGAAKFRKLAGPGTLGAFSAGAYHPIPPTRVYDSRISQGGPGQIVGNENRILSAGFNNPFLSGIAATAITINVTLAETVGFGLISMYAFGDPQPNSSLMNWTSSGAVLANGTTLKVGGTNQFVVHCEGIATQFIIDVMGYWA